MKPKRHQRKTKTAPDKIQKSYKEYTILGHKIRSYKIDLAFRKKIYFFVIKLYNYFEKELKIGKAEMKNPENQQKLGEGVLTWLHDPVNIKDVFETFIQSDMSFVDLKKFKEGGDDELYIEVLGTCNNILGDFFSTITKLKS